MWAVVPIKNLKNVKTRLADCLSQSERSQLVHCMVEDVIAAVTAVPALEGVLVVSIDADIKRLVELYGAHVLAQQSDQGHDAAIAGAVSWLNEKGADGFMQIPGDIPTVTSDELSDVVAMHNALSRSNGLFTICPSHDYGGSNCIACTPLSLIELKFGPDSFRRHLVSARAAGVETQIVERPGIALDIDYPEDLERLLQTPATTRTHQFLAESGIQRRISSNRMSA